MKLSVCISRRGKSQSVLQILRRGTSQQRVEGMTHTSKNRVCVRSLFESSTHVHDSSLCGAAARYRDPKLATLTTSQNLQHRSKLTSLIAR